MEKTYMGIDLAKIVCNPFNRRKCFEGEKFNQLVKSIEQKGVIEPILARPVNGNFEVVAGERRYKGSLEAKLVTIPALVQEMTDDEAFEIMTIENLQREDLTPLEEAESFKDYLDRKGVEALPELAEKTGIPAKFIMRRIRVLSLPEKV
jgi:ParB family chromosome partitioning protein